ncbi:hypothetical protein HCDG_08018 [Histoplasma capsulatum H143]|uniref:Uncharacterized protein n=1 Tax=Ajellomyces capsulatus (strain H143) TaxID=544712 RepID=C6HP87_AJECH|nr:hypothetical protein HCDG_08018 [Histoplasma capsulatum H143]
MAVITGLLGEEIAHRDLQLQKGIVLDCIRAQLAALSAVITFACLIPGMAGGHRQALHFTYIASFCSTLAAASHGCARPRSSQTKTRAKKTNERSTSSAPTGSSTLSFIVMICVRHVGRD